MASRDPLRPNILVITSDDQGYWALGAAGNDEIRTPHLDRLAAGGVRFEQFYCTSPVCSPARASLLTGEIPSQHGVHDAIVGGNIGPDAIDYLAGRRTYPQYLADIGYRCAMMGKWHLGASDEPRPEYVHWYAHQAGRGPYHGAPMVRDGQLVDEPGYLTDLLGDEACRFIAAESHRDSPWLLCMNFTAPHAPWIDDHPPELVELYAACAFTSCPQEQPHPWMLHFAQTTLAAQRDPLPSLRGYFAAVTAMDAQIGRVLAALERLDLTGTTLVLFLSDNGFNAGHHGIWGKGNGTDPLNVYDTSVRVPAIASQPGRVPGGWVSHDLLSGYDVLPTLLDWVSHPGPDSPLPGRSFAGVLSGAATEPSPFVVVYDEYGPVRMIRTSQWKYVQRHPDGPDELYDMTNDPAEHRNLVDQGDLTSLREELSSALDGWFERWVTDPGRDGRHLPVSGAGQRQSLSGHVGVTPNAFQPLPPDAVRRLP